MNDDVTVAFITAGANGIGIAEGNAMADEELVVEF